MSAKLRRAIRAARLELKHSQDALARLNPNSRKAKRMKQELGLKSFFIDLGAAIHKQETRKKKR